MGDRRLHRFNLIVAVVLGAALVVVLVVRPPFPRTVVSVPAGQTVGVETGTTGVEFGDEGAFWWITAPASTVRLTNNDADPVEVEVSARITNGPCATSRTITFGPDTAPLPEGGVEPVASGSIQLAPYERTVVELVVDGEPCGPTATDGRMLYVRIDELTVRRLSP